MPRRDKSRVSKKEHNAFVCKLRKILNRVPRSDHATVLYRAIADESPLLSRSNRDAFVSAIWNGSHGTHATYVVPLDSEDLDSLRRAVARHAKRIIRENYPNLKKTKMVSLQHFYSQQDASVADWARDMEDDESIGQFLAEFISCLEEKDRAVFVLMRAGSSQCKIARLFGIAASTAGLCMARLKMRWVLAARRRMVDA